MKRKRISLPIIIVGLLIISSCATTGPPVTEQEIKTAEEELKKQAEIFRKEQEERINKVASALMKNLDQTNSPKIKFTLADDQEVNAGATFGLVMITTGMMRFIKTDDELAVVLGHEIAHITKNHIAKSMAVDLPLMIIDLAMIVVDPNLYNLTSLITDALSKKFSREQEKEADYFGLQSAAKAGYNPNGGVKIWERFAIEIPKSMTKNLWASHPSSPERMVKAKKTALELQEGKLQNLLKTSSKDKVMSKADLAYRFGNHKVIFSNGNVQIIQKDILLTVDEIFVLLGGEIVAGPYAVSANKHIGLSKKELVALIGRHEVVNKVERVEIIKKIKRFIADQFYILVDDKVVTGPHVSKP